MADEKDLNRQKAKEMLIQVKVYRILAGVFAVAGVVIFMALYFKYMDGRLLDALTEPATIVMILIPFFPAVVLSMLASRMEKNLMMFLKKNEENPAKSEDASSQTEEQKAEQAAATGEGR